MKVGVIGTGYVGLVAGACFADCSNIVTCVDIDENKIENLKKGIIPIYEPGLTEIVKRNFEKERLIFTTDIKEAIKNCEVIFIAVGTPQSDDGSADLQYVLKVAEEIGKNLTEYRVIVDKSTVPVGTAEKVKETISKYTDVDFDVVSNPEFLKEGDAIDDFVKPDRVVIGSNSEKATKIMKKLYEPFVRNNHPIYCMDIVSAEMTKYAANAMLATRISFMNQIANLCELTGADVNNVRLGIGSDSRIGMSFLYPGIGYGGSCFPKDVKAIIKSAKDFDYDFSIANAVEDANKKQKSVLANKVLAKYGTDLKGKTFAVWGLAFKPGTDDIREAPSLTICKKLIESGAKIVGFDPEANKTFASEFGEDSNIEYKSEMYQTLNNADALIVCTEWKEFRNPDFDKIKSSLNSNVIFDGRNLYSPSFMKDNNFEYHSIGRATV